MSCFAAAAGLTAALEAPHLLPPRPNDPTDSGQRRPADVLIQPWTHGAPAALDLAIVSPQRQDVLQQASVTRGHAALRYEQRKRDYQQTAQQCEAQGISFIPVVAERSGGWGSSARKALRKIAKSAAQRSGRDQGLISKEYLEVLCVGIRRSKARAVLKRAGCAEDQSPIWTNPESFMESD